MTSVIEEIPVVAAETDKTIKKKRDKKNFSLIDPDTKKTISKFTTFGFREAALKAASRKYTVIVLRNDDGKIKTYEGEIQELENPKTIKRGEREVLFTKKPTVKHVKNSPEFDELAKTIKVTRRYTRKRVDVHVEPTVETQ